MRRGLQLVVAQFRCFGWFSNLRVRVRRFLPFTQLEIIEFFLRSFVGTWLAPGPDCGAPAPGYSWSGNGGGRRQRGEREHVRETKRRFSPDRVFDIILGFISFFIVLNQ